MTPRIAAAALCAGLLTTGSVYSQATIGGQWREDLDRFSRRVVDTGLAPGLGVAVSQGEWVLYESGFGLADASSDRRASADTAFYIASSTKALTATAVALLAARGELDLSAPITIYLPDLDLREPLDASAITLERLLTMTDGIEQAGPVTFRTAYTGEFTPELLIDLLSEYGPSRAGNDFSYRNLPYNILGLALGPRNGHGWKDVVRREVLEPLGMRATSARLSALDREAVAMPHELVPGEGWRRVRLDKADANLHAAGGHFSSAHDLIRFVAAHAGLGRLEGVSVFPEGAIESMRRPHVAQDREFGPYHRIAWGYGWDIGEWEGRTIVHRFGGFTGYRSHMSFEPATGIGVVVLTNGDGIASPATDLVASYIYDRLVGREDFEAVYERELSELISERPAFESRVAAHLAERAARRAPLSHPLEHFAGTYESPSMGRTVWQVVADGLEMRAGVAGSRAEVYDAASNTLRIEIGGGATARFEFPDGGGPATAVIIRDRRFDRVAPRDHP